MAEIRDEIEMPRFLKYKFKQENRATKHRDLTLVECNNMSSQRRSV